MTPKEYFSAKNRYYDLQKQKREKLAIRERKIGLSCGLGNDLVLINSDIAAIDAESTQIMESIIEAANEKVQPL